MRKNKNIQLSVINIVLHPHSKERYVELIKESFGIKKSIKIRGQYYGLPIQILDSNLNPKENYILGKFFRYTEIDASKPWLDVKKASLLIDDEGNAIPQIDENKKPNSTEINFSFILSNHRLVFDSSKITPGSMRDFLSNLFKQTKFSNIKHNEITINIEQSSESIDEILNMFSITELDIMIYKPNPDDIDSLEERFQRRLLDVKADSLKEEYKSKSGSIKPDERAKKLMEISQSNGYTLAKGRNRDGKSVTESTEKHPLFIKKTYNTETSTYLNAIKEFSFTIVSDIMARLRR